MVEYVDSSQNTAWHFASKQELEQCRAYTNYRARLFIYQREQQQQQQQNKNGTAATTIDAEVIPERLQQSQSDAPPSTVTSNTPDVAPSSLSSSILSTSMLITTTNGSTDTMAAMWSTASTTMINSLPISCYVCNEAERMNITKDPSINYCEMGPWESPATKKNTYITPKQEMILINFYGTKISSMIGPNAEIKRLRREGKVVATAAILYRRFFLSNSVLMYDPKSIMIAATFLACKVEDVTCDIRYIEQGTLVLNAPVSIPEIVTGEIVLLSGIHYNLLCYHPYKSTLALTEDLRTFLKTSIGQQTFTVANNNNNSRNDGSESSSSSVSTMQLLSGQDLKPMYDIARTLLDRIIISDVPLLYSPGQIGIAALTVAHDEVMKQKQHQQQLPNTDTTTIPLQQQEDILCRVYLPARFPTADHTVLELLPETIMQITNEIRTLQQNHVQSTIGNSIEQYMNELKIVHKQLKKVRIWGSNTGTTDSSTSKKSRKRSKEAITPTPQKETTTSTNGDANISSMGPPSKRLKTE